MSVKRKIIIADVRESLSGKGAREELAESTLSRIWKNFKENQFGIITSWRDDVSQGDNEKDFYALTSEIRNAGYGFIMLKGHGQEEDDKTKQVKQVEESSLLVKNLKTDGSGEPVVDSRAFDNFIIELGQRYDQWGIVLHLPEPLRKGQSKKVKRVTRLVTLKDEEGNPSPPKSAEYYGKFDPKGVGKFFSEIRSGRTFHFEGFKYESYADRTRPDGWFHGMYLWHQTKEYKKLQRDKKNQPKPKEYGNYFTSRDCT